MRKLYIFDCFGVVLGELAPIWFTSRYGVERGTFLKNKFFDGGDKGEKNISEIITDIERELSIPTDIILAEWDKLILANDTLLKLVNKLRNKNAVSILSNAPSGLFDIVLKKVPLNEYFDNIFISGDMKIIKPDPKSYFRCIQSYNENFSKIYMIDDNENNLVGLENLGITPILFKNNTQLECFIRSEEE